MRCIFVMDILNGRVVHAVRGERSGYRPIDQSSGIVTTSDPLGVLDEVSPREVYVADLNRLTKSGDNLLTIEEISSRVSTWADTGIENAEDMNCLSEGIVPVLGTETVSLANLERAASGRGVVASVDMKARKVLARDRELAALCPLNVIERLNALPLKAVILLELDRVGTSCGLDRDFLQEAASSSRHPLILGGGVKDLDDLRALEEMGFDGALVATAVHNGRIPLEMVRSQIDS
ncbi:MAG: nickel transporter [Methanotrichaceae archaeon]|nr:nickel transporter [Methanotrichaceae archaeon]